DDVQIADNVCDHVLGARSWYVCELGNGPKPLRSTTYDATSSKPTNTTLRDQLHMTHDELAYTRTELADTRTELFVCKDRLHLMESQQAMIVQFLNKVSLGAS
ncbi:hypothetical protein Pfo_002130, partial [Paulownia fortunei]